MKTTGRPARIAFLLVLLSGMCAIAGRAQNSVNVSATVTETTIFTGERISLSVEVSGSFNDVSRPELPGFPGFRLLSKNPSISRSYSYVNGETSTSYTYSYYLIAQATGAHRIPSITITIDGTEYKTEPIDVQIVDRNSSADQPAEGSSRPEIFLRLEVPDTRPVPGQQLVADVVLFFKDGLEVNSYQPVPGWKAEGFWKEELENTKRPRASSTVIDGVRYRRARLLQFALFPTKMGELTISPYEIIVSVRSSSSRDDPFSSFFGGFGTNQRQVELQTEPVTLQVEPLPGVDDATYTGAVGSFDISRSISSREALVGESIEVTTRIRGTGNVPLLSKPEYEIPEGLEVYDPQETSDINRRNRQISGTKTFTDILIARSPGTYTLPETRLAYYDPARGSYRRVTLPALSFTVKRDPDAPVTDDRPQALHIQPVTGLASWVAAERGPLTGYWWFWVGLLLPGLVLGLAYWQKTYRERMGTDTAFARSQTAYQKAQERLEEAVAKSETGDIKTAYNLLQKSLTGFIGDRLNLPEAGLSNEQYLEALRERQVDDELVKNVRMLLDKCATISYAPDATADYLKSHVGLAHSIIDKLKKVL